MGSKTAETHLRRALRELRVPRKRLQFGALCHRQTEKGLRILLVTSRRSRRWVSPKGWPMRGLNGPATAATEAFEEAGVRGAVGARGLGFYSYRKTIGKGKAITCVVQMFPLEVNEELDAYRERGQRQRRWLKPGRAAKLVAEPGLARIIREFAAQAEAGGR